MKKLLFFLLLATAAFGQGSFYQLPVPLPNAIVRVCPINTANPCPSPSSIFSDSGLTVPVANPFNVGVTGNFAFFVAAGQYLIQIGPPYSQNYVISLGGGGGGSFSSITGGTNTNALVVGSGGTLSATGTGAITATNGVGGTSSAAPTMAYYLAPQCPANNTGQCFQTPANTQVNQLCTFTTANANVVCPAGTFTAADVGKFIFGYDTCNPFVSLPRATFITTTHNTITAFVSSSTVTMNANGAAGTTASNGCVIWGNPDDAGAAALSTAVGSLTTSPTCPKVFLSAAGYMFTSVPGFMNGVQPPGCLPTPVLTGPGSVGGNTFLMAGYEVEGRGPGTTILWLPPDFPESGTCTNGRDSNVCFDVPVEGKYSNFQISGGAANTGATTIGNNHGVIGLSVGSLEYFTCTNVGSSSSQTNFGVYANQWSQLQQVNVSACGNANLYVGGGAQATGFRVAVENAYPQVNLGNLVVTGGGVFNCYDCEFFGSQVSGSATQFQSILQTGGTIRLFHPSIEMWGSTVPNVGYQCHGTGTLHIEDGLFAVGSGSNQYDIFTDSTGICTIDVNRTVFSAIGTGNTYLNQNAGSILLNGEGNSGWQTGSGISTNGFILNNDAQGTVGITAAKAVLSAGWGNTPTAAWSALQGGNSYTGTITNGTAGLAASPTITYTFPTPYLVAPNVCQAVQTGGTNAVGTFTASSLTKTGVTFTFSLTPTASATEVVSVFCQ